MLYKQQHNTHLWHIRPCQYGGASAGITNNSNIHWTVAEYNAYYAWYYNGNNGTLNNNNKYNTNQSRPTLERRFDDDQLEKYPIPYSFFLKCYKTCRKHKRNKASQLLFENDQIHELITLCHEVNNMQYEQRTSIAFIITKPKVREVLAADFRDRIAQTVLVQKLLPYLENYLHPDSYSCRVGKGGLKAAQQFSEYVREVSENYTRDCWLFSLDLQGFFPSIDTKLWTRELVRFIDQYYDGEDKELVKYLTKSIYLYQPQNNCVKMSPAWMWGLLDPKKSLIGKTNHIGIAIGNVTAQVLALFVTTIILRILERLGIKFVCYTDDIKGIVREKKEILKRLPWLRKFIWRKCHLKLHPDKFDLQHFSKGIRVGAFKLRFNRVLPNDRIAHNFKYKIDRLVKKCKEDAKFVLRKKNDIMAFVNSYLGMLRHCNAFNLRKEQIERMKQTVVEKVFTFSRWYDKINIKKQYTEIFYRWKINQLQKRYVMYALWSRNFT